MEFPPNRRRRRRKSRSRRFTPLSDRPLLFSPPTVADAGEWKASRGAAACIIEELSSASLADPPSAALPRLLRCCFRLLPYLHAGDKYLARVCRLRLFDSLRRVLSHDPSPSLLPAIEVFLGNLDELRAFFVTGYGAVPEEYCTALHVRHRTALELTCSHFISSLADEGGSWAFLNALSWSGNKSQGAPEICFREAFALFNITSLFPLSAVVEAHLLLLASRCVSDLNLDSRLRAFQYSMDIYVHHLPALGIFNRIGGVKALVGKTPLIFCIKQVTRQKLENQVNRLLSFCKAHAGDNLPISDSGICDISDRLIEENQHMLHEKFRQEARTVVRSILSKALHCAKQTVVNEYDAEMLQEAICLAAVLRLMGSLLLQILHLFSEMGADDDKGNAKNHVPVRMVFRNLCDDTIRLLGHYQENELHRCDFISTTGQPVHRERASIQMLAHFSSLLIFSVRRRFGFLWRVCIIMMMMAMNLAILEDEITNTFQLLKESAGIPDANKCKLTLALIPETDNSKLQMQVYARRSSKAIALQMNALRNQSTEKVDGRALLQCLPDYNPSRDADLVDFIECKAGKDYSNTLDQQNKFRSFKNEKRSIITKRRRQDMQSWLPWIREDMPCLPWR